MDPRAWLARVDELEASIRKVCDDARAQDEPAAKDAVADMLDHPALVVADGTQRKSDPGRRPGADEKIVRRDTPGGFW